MTRSISSAPPSLGVASLSEANLKHRREKELDLLIRCRLVTPLFGGGHTAGENDLVFPVSPKGIRGQLRHWWRLMMGAGLAKVAGIPSAEIMWLRETEVFGSSDLPSPVDLNVRILTESPLPRRPPGASGRPYGFNRYGPEAYALFPVVQKVVQNQQAPGLLKEGVGFELTLRWLDDAAFARRTSAEGRRRQESNKKRRDANKPEWPEPWDDFGKVRRHVEVSLWAWLNFGGIGARTRRGLGAVTTADPRFALLDEPGRLRHAVPGMTIHCGSPKSGNEAPIAAWGEALNAYRQFRQDRRDRGHRGTATPGRSFWPEPDSLRQITGCSLHPSPGAVGTSSTAAHNHSAPVVSSDTLPGFPRALLGLPIIFHFAPGDGQDKERRQDPFKDPSDAELVPHVVKTSGETGPGQRMGSPVITRPLFVKGRWHAAVMILRGPHLQGLEAYVKVKGVDAAGGTEAKEACIPNDRIVNAAFASLRPMRGKNDALDALESYIQSKDFRFLS
jgi:CRISPR-associated protein Cmr1